MHKIIISKLKFGRLREIWTRRISQIQKLMLSPGLEPGSPIIALDALTIEL